MNFYKIDVFKLKIDKFIKFSYKFKNMSDLNGIISEMNGLNLNNLENKIRIAPIQVSIEINNMKIMGLFMPSFYIRQDRCISTLISNHIELLSPKIFAQIGSKENKNEWYKVIKVLGNVEMTLEQWLHSKELVVFSDL